MTVAVATDSHEATALDVIATIPEWWARRAEEAGLAGEWRSWRRALQAPPLPLSGSVRPKLLDAGVFALGEAYIESLNGETRLADGRHYTPAVLAYQLWKEIRQARAGEGGCIVDPACGAGALLVPALRSFVAAAHDPATALDGAPKRFGGTDLDLTAVWLGNALLAAELLPLWAQIPDDKRKPLPQLLGIGDGLMAVGDAPQTIVLNPPYGRLRLDANARERWQESLYGHVNRYGLFLHAAVERVAPGGIVAAVIPTSFLGGAYFQRLRTFLATHAPLARLVFVHERSGVFAGGVLQQTCLAVFRKGSKPKSVACAQITVNGQAELKKLPEVVNTKGRTDLPWLLPRRSTDGPVIKKATSLRARLSDYGWRVTTGPLVWNRHKRQIFGTPAPGRLPVVWAADLDGGILHRDSRRDAQRWITLRERDDFMKLKEPALLVQRTTAPEQARRLVLAALDASSLEEWGGAVVIENHVNVLRLIGEESPLTPKLLARLLATRTFDRLYRCITGSVAVSAYELEALPLPPVPVVRRWQSLAPVQLSASVARYYGDVDS